MTGSRQGAHGGSRLSPLWVSRLSPMPQSWTPAGGGGPLAGLARLSPGCAPGPLRDSQGICSSALGYRRLPLNEWRRRRRLIWCARAGVSGASV
jgi:hypothetical protein